MAEGKWRSTPSSTAGSDISEIDCDINESGEIPKYMAGGEDNVDPYTGDIHCRWNEDEESYICSLCDSTMNSEETLRTHMAGKKHQKKLATFQLVNNVKPAESKPTHRPSNVRKIVTGPLNGVFLSTVAVNTPAIIQPQLDKVTKPILGLGYITEIQRLHDQVPLYRCSLCPADCQFVSIIGHLLGIKHKMQYFATNFPDVYRELKVSPYSLDRHCAAVEAKYGRSKICVEVEMKASGDPATAAAPFQQYADRDMGHADSPPSTDEEQYNLLLESVRRFGKDYEVGITLSLAKNLFEDELRNPVLCKEDKKRLQEACRKLKRNCVDAVVDSMDASAFAQMSDSLSGCDQFTADNLILSTTNGPIEVAFREVIEALRRRGE